MQNERKFGFSIRNAILAFHNYRQVIPFIRKHRLWEGLGQYSWIIGILILGGAIVSLKLVNIVKDWWDQTENMGMSLSTVGNLFSNFATEGYELFVMGAFKYIILILLEVVIFHFARRTLEVLSGEKAEAGFDAFVKAQIRMIKVVLFSFVMETIVSAIGGVILGIAGMGYIKPAFTFAVQCYFLGFAFIDNFNEIYNLSIKQSSKYTQQYIGAAMAIGIVVYILMLLPLLGTLLAPLLGAVVATITMYEIEQREGKMEAFLLASVKEKEAKSTK